MTLRLDPARPFVLLDDARDGGASPAKLFADPRAVAAASRVCEVEPLLATLERWSAEGRYVAGMLSYEAGFALDPALPAPPLSADGWPLGWFAAFDRVEELAPDVVGACLPSPDAAVVSQPAPEIDVATYDARVTTVLEHIRAGNFYQANLTFAAEVMIHGNPLAAFARVRARQRAGYGAVVWTGRHLLLSFSPELFFAVDRNGRVRARPMKGTAARSPRAEKDARAVRELIADPKQRAENLMIVDLMRNDLSRVSRVGSVGVPTLFHVETYPTVHQMVSEVVAELEPGRGAVDVLRAAFPCGSITGAPKLSAMQRLIAIEHRPRGAYTGSVGFIAPDGSAAFNVAIRSLSLEPAVAGDLPRSPARATLGLGSGIVADSRARDEWAECRTKGEFLTSGIAHFDLIETMAFAPDEGIRRLDLHLARLGSSAAALGFRFDRHALRNQLQHATFRCGDAARVRLRLSRTGATSISVDSIPDRPDVLTVSVVPESDDGPDVRRLHKTSDRRPHRAAFAAGGGADEVVLVDPAGRLTEGTWTTLFVRREGGLVTPPLSRGILPGVLRQALLASGEASEADVRPDDLAGGFYLGNALRGLMPARLAH